MEDKKAEGDLMERIWSYLKAHSLTCSAVWLLVENLTRNVCQNVYIWTPNVTWAPSQHGSLERVVAGGEREARGEEGGREGEGDRNENGGGGGENEEVVGGREEERNSGNCTILSDVVLELNSITSATLLFFKTVADPPRFKK